MGMCLCLWLCFPAGSEAYHLLRFWLCLCAFVKTYVCKKSKTNKRNLKKPTLHHTSPHLTPPLPPEFLICMRMLCLKQTLKGNHLTPFTSALHMNFLPSTLQVDTCLLNFLKTFGMLTFLLAWWHEGAWADLSHSCCYWFFTFVEQTSKIHFASFSKTTFPTWLKPEAFRIEKACHVQIVFFAAQSSQFYCVCCSKAKSQQTQSYCGQTQKEEQHTKQMGNRGFWSTKWLDVHHLPTYCVYSCRIAGLDIWQGSSRTTEATLVFST